MAKSKLPKSKVKRLMLSKSSVPRVSGEAVEPAADIAAEFLEALGEKAAGIANAHGRKTIMAEDLRQACEVTWGGDACRRIVSKKKKRRQDGTVDHAPIVGGDEQ